MTPQSRRAQAYRFARWSGQLLINTVDIFLDVQHKLKEMAVLQNQAQGIRECCNRLEDQLVVIYRVCSSPQLRCLNPADQSTCFNRIDTSLQQMAKLFHDIQDLDAEIRKRDNSLGQWFTDRLQALGIMDEPNWKKLHATCITSLDEIQKNVDAISTISIQNILEKVTEAHAILQRTVSQMSDSSRAGGGQYPVHSSSNRAYRRSNVLSSCRNIAAERRYLSTNSFHLLESDHDQTRFDEEDLLDGIRRHPRYLWDGEANEAQIRGGSGSINLNTTVQVVLLGLGPHGTGPSIVFWDTEMHFWHFQIQQKLPYSSMPVVGTSRSVRIIALRHQLSGVQMLEWIDEQTEHMKMQIVLSFPRVQAARRIRSVLEGYRIRQKSRIIARDGSGGENPGIAEVVDLEPPHRFSNDIPSTLVVSSSGIIRVLQIWPFGRKNAWAVGQSLIWLHVTSLSASYSLNPRQKHILQLGDATIIRSGQGIASLRSSPTEEISETFNFDIEFEKERDAERTLHLLMDFQELDSVSDSG